MMYSMEEHQKQRKRFYGAMPDFWADLYGTEYALLDYYTLTAREVEQIRTATNRIGHLYRKTARLLRQLPDETLQLLGFHPEALPFLRISVLSAETVIARADLVHVDGTFKLIELNADTPTFIRETFDINEHAASFFRLASPNKGAVKTVTEAIQHAIWQSYRLLRAMESHMLCLLLTTIIWKIKKRSVICSESAESKPPMFRFMNSTLFLRIFHCVVAVCCGVDCTMRKEDGLTCCIGKHIRLSI
jgi:hypothetical protein